MDNKKTVRTIRRYTEQFLTRGILTMCFLILMMIVPYMKAAHCGIEGYVIYLAGLVWGPQLLTFALYAGNKRMAAMDLLVAKISAIVGSLVGGGIVFPDARADILLSAGSLLLAEVLDFLVRKGIRLKKIRKQIQRCRKEGIRQVRRGLYRRRRVVLLYSLLSFYPFTTCIGSYARHMRAWGISIFIGVTGAAFYMVAQKVTIRSMWNMLQYSQKEGCENQAGKI